MATTYTYQPQPKTFSTFPPVVKYLLIANIAVFLLQMFTTLQRTLIDDFALHTIVSQLSIQHGGSNMLISEIKPFQAWQLITYSFLHGDYAHILLNMFALWMFGSVIEKVWGGKRFLFYYFACVIGAAIAQLIVQYLRTQSLLSTEPGTLSLQEMKYAFESINVPTVGASGGVFGLLLAFGMMFPKQPIYFLFLPVPIPAMWFVIIYGAIELFMGVTGTMSGIAHFAHLGGMIFGFILIQYWLGKLPWKPVPGKLF
ncbi:MAG: rhomboid family intramembrane serine protease [Verrucomicrobiota bacterium]